MVISFHWCFSVLGTSVGVFTLCPGFVYTGLFRYTVQKMSLIRKIFFAPVGFFFMRNAKQVRTFVYKIYYCTLEAYIILWEACGNYWEFMGWEESCWEYNSGSVLWDDKDNSLSEQESKSDCKVGMEIRHRYVLPSWLFTPDVSFVNYVMQKV